MTLRQSVLRAAAGTAFIGIVIAGLSIQSPRVKADEGNNGNNDDSKIQIGFAIAPVPLNLAGKDRALVGLGSYIVNAQADCDGCHSAGPATEFSPGGNPYFGQHPTKVNPATYLGGGRDFGPFPSPASPVHIFSRNLTPDKTGKPEGGHTFEEFRQIIRHGKDFDHLHPTCPTNAPNCLPPPFDGDLLQIMPWNIYQNMTDHDIRAIYEYLSAIPCLDTIVAGQPQLRNDCH
jgi:hypothetical protein